MELIYGCCVFFRLISRSGKNKRRANLTCPEFNVHSILNHKKAKTSIYACVCAPIRYRHSDCGAIRNMTTDFRSINRIIYGCSVPQGTTAAGSDDRIWRTGCTSVRGSRLGYYCGKHVKKSKIRIGAEIYFDVAVCKQSQAVQTEQRLRES